MAITDYFSDVRAEMKHVSWPTRRLAMAYTAVVVGVSLAVAIYLGALDFIFSTVLKHII